MNEKKPTHIYLRMLKQISPTVFCVERGQKTYYNPEFENYNAYSSGQQVKRSIINRMNEILNREEAPVIFNKVINNHDELENKQIINPCDPAYPDQLIGGWMSANDQMTIKRRSPLSVGVMIPLHPMLANTFRENITFDRSSNTRNHKVVVRDPEGNVLSDEEVEEYMLENNRNNVRRAWIPENRRTSGLFKMDLAIDLRWLFSVSLDKNEPSLSPNIEKRLRTMGWEDSENWYGKVLLAPKELRNEVIPALAESILTWMITSNQSRHYAPQEIMAIAISDNAHRPPLAIRSKMVTEQKAVPVIEPVKGVDLFATVHAEEHIPAESLKIETSVDAVDDAVENLKERMQGFDYEKQQKPRTIEVE